MKNILLALTFSLTFALTFSGDVRAQDEPKVCISQEAANKCVTVAAELIEARKVIADFQRLDAKSVAEREAAGVLIKGLNDLIAVKDRIETEREKMMALYERVIAMQQGIIDQLEKRLNRPKSGFSKFLDVLKAVGYILAGVSLGRGI